MRYTLACALLLAGLAGCDDNYIAFTPDGGHGGTDSGPHDAGGNDGAPFEPPTVVAQCGEPVVRAITETATNIEVETSGAAMDSAALCGKPAGTQHVFVAIDAEPGEVWHVHLTGIDGAGGLPRMALITEACDLDDCAAEASFCEGGGDEHFTFEADSDRRYWVAVNDAMTGGGRYRADVFRLVCGDGTQAHGEACDDGNRVAGDGCDRDCRVELSTLRDAEVEPNDNRFEANALVLDGGALSVTGTIGGASACAYPDVFTLAAPGGDLRVSIGPQDGTCDSSSDAPVRVRVLTAEGATNLMFDADLTDCASEDLTLLGPSVYSVEVSTGERAVPLAYRLTVETL